MLCTLLLDHNISLYSLAARAFDSRHRYSGNIVRLCSHHISANSRSTVILTAYNAAFLNPALQDLSCLKPDGLLKEKPNFFKIRVEHKTSGVGSPFRFGMSCCDVLFFFGFT